MTNVNSSAVRHALNQTTAAREAIGYFIQRILQQFNNVNHSWNDQQSRRLYAIVLDSVTSLRASYGELRSLEESLKKTLDTVEKYEQIGRATRTTAKNPGAKLVWCIGMLGSELLPVLRQGAEQYKAITGDNSVYLLELPNTTPETVGARQHPGAESHRQAAKVLTAFLKTIL